MKTILALLIGLLIGYPALAQENQPAYDNLPLNQFQIIGSHNSYKQAIDPPLRAVLQQTDAAMADALDYSHIDLSDQLAMGLRNLEVDVYADTQGGRYAHPKGLGWVEDSASVAPYDPEGKMNAPGFKALHVQDVDFRSSCLTLEECLQELTVWSDAHPNHFPVFITMNAKDDPIDRPGFSEPEKFTAPVLDQLDKTILNALGKEKLLTPDQVRGITPTLEQAVLEGRWPTLAEARGKFLFILDETGEKRAAYVQGHPSLAGRVMFANAEPDTPEAAWLIMNEPIRDLKKIRKMVRKGYIVRTRADANTQEARENDQSKFEAACQSGAQIITTDYYRKSTHFPSDYVIRFDKDEPYFRVNPLTYARINHDRSGEDTTTKKGRSQ